MPDADYVSAHLVRTQAHVFVEEHVAATPYFGEMFTKRKSESLSEVRVPELFRVGSRRA